jgi:hypothetical protein
VVDLVEASTFDGAFATDVLRGLASIAEDDFGRDSLRLALSMSLWTRHRGVSYSRAVEILLSVREAVLGCASLDERSEPVPLLHPDIRTTLLSVSSYLGGLIARAGRSSGMTRGEIAERASVLLLAG